MSGKAPSVDFNYTVLLVILSFRFTACLISEIYDKALEGQLDSRSIRKMIADLLTCTPSSHSSLSTDAFEFKLRNFDTSSTK